MQTSSNWPDFSVNQSPERENRKFENRRRRLTPSVDARMGRTDEAFNEFAPRGAASHKRVRTAGLVRWDECARGAAAARAKKNQATPPLARRIWPFTQPPSGPARNETMREISSGWPRRSSGGILA